MDNLVLLDTDRSGAKEEGYRTHLKSWIINQDPAIELLCSAYGFHVSPFKSGVEIQGPIGIFIFLGPSGVGKTEMARQTAHYFCGSRDALTIIDCGTYQEKHEVARVIGSPPGYLGHGETPAILTQENIDRHAYNYLYKHDSYIQKIRQDIEALNKEIEEKRAKIGEVNKLKNRQKKLQEDINNHIHGDANRKNIISIILLDEFEKAHYDLQDALLGISNNAKLTLGNGDITDFSNSIIILSSNIGQDEIAKQFGPPLGFAPRNRVKDTTKQIALRAVKKRLRTESFGRIENNIVVFNALEACHLHKILELKLIEIQKITAKQSASQNLAMTLLVEQDARDYIVKTAMASREYGARMIEHQVNDHIAAPLARLFASGQIQNKNIIRVVMHDGQIRFVRNKNDLELNTPPS